jgi:predicted permease
MGQNSRFAIRTLVKNPGFTLIAVFALALGIGANTAIFTVVDRVLLRPMAYDHADRLVNIVRKFKGGKGPSLSIPKFAFIKEATLLEAVSVYDFMGPGMNLSGAGHPEQVKGVHVSEAYFRMLGVAPAIGRTFSPEEDRPNAPRVTVLTNGLWKRRFGGDPGAVGRTIRINSEPFTVIGVMGVGFSGEPETDLFLAEQADLNSANQGHFLFLGARLKPGVAIEQANAELRAITERFRKRYPGVMGPDETFSAQSMTSTLTGDLRTPLFVLLGAVAFVLLIACANVANLLLARAAGRSKEIALRMALGASRGAILRQLLTESVLLALAGGVAGVLLGAIGLRVLLTVAPAELPRLPAEGLGLFGLMDGRILVFALAVSLLTGILFGLVPALQISRTDLNVELREGSARTSAGARRQRTRSTLVVLETALSLVLLVGAALMIRTFLALRNVQPGFQAASVLTMSTSLAGQKYETAAGVERLATEITRRLEALPGVQSATYALSLPLQMGPDLPFSIAGKAPSGGGPFNGDEQYRPVGAHYFQTLGIPLRRGRWFDERDTSTSRWALIINEAMAKKYWPNENPVGAIVTIGKGLGPEFDDRPREVVGVVGNVRESGIDQDAPPVQYIPVGQEPNGLVALSNRVLPSSWAVRTMAGPAAALGRAIQQEVLRVDSDLPVARVMTMERVIAKSIARHNFIMILLGIFGGVALLLAAIGIYGVMSYTVEQRTHELGIRIALGAATPQLLRMVVGQGLLLAGIGVAIGLAASFGVTRVMASLLYGVKATDLATFGTVAGVLSAVAALACYIPARRATRVDPIIALRHD